MEKQKLLEIVELYDKASASYKVGQLLFAKIDKKIHNEFVYVSRAQNSIIKGLLENSYSDRYFISAVEDFEKAVKHVINDCLDLIVFYAIKETKALRERYQSIAILEVYPEYKRIKSIVENFREKIISSREDRGNRLSDYLEMVASQDYKILVDYCISLPDIEDVFAITEKKEIKKNRIRWLYGGVVPVFIGFITVAASIYF